MAAFSVAGLLTQSLTSKALAVAQLAKVGGAVASGSMLAGLSSLGQALSSSVISGSAMSSLGPLLGPLQASAATLVNSPIAARCVASMVGGAVAVGAVPAVVSALGFTGAGIAASSVAAKMMSISAIANGGGVAAGGLVATLQSVGATGLSMSSKIILGAIGSRIGVLVTSL